jgi:hypothetical protein
MILFVQKVSNDSEKIQDLKSPNETASGPNHSHHEGRSASETIHQPESNKDARQ